jgi:hypothetical protein
MKHRRYLTICLLPGLLMATGCTGWIKPTETRLELVTHDEQGRHDHFARFPRAYYAVNAAGLLELLLISEEPSTLDPTQNIRQIVYLREFWNPRPGKTYANATQINAEVTYAMLTPPTGVRYDGGAFLTYKKEGNEIAGWIESGNVKPRYRMGGAIEPFGPATFKGTFRARENPARIVELRHELDTLFQAR